MAIDKDKIPQPLSDAELESMIRGLREIGVSAKEIEKIMEGVNRENQKLIKNLEHVESVQKRINTLNIKDNDVVQQVNTLLEERIEKEGKITKFTEDRVKNLEEAVKRALSFESLWLRTKSSYYMNVGNSYLNRASVLDDRI